jgi:hypothetical protein
LGIIPDRKRDRSLTALIKTCSDWGIRLDFDGAVNANGNNAKSEKQRWRVEWSDSYCFPSRTLFHADDFDRAMRGRNYRRRHAPEHKTHEAIVPARHDEKAIGAPTFGFVQQRLFRIAGGDHRRPEDRNSPAAASTSFCIQFIGPPHCLGALIAFFN